MKNRKHIIAWMFALMGSLVPVSAQAVPFSISNIAFSDLVGNNEGFRWSVTAGDNVNFELEVGQSHTFTYGTFSTSDFPISFFDAFDNNDSFRVGFDITPPLKAASSQGFPDARFAFGPDIVSVDFDNTQQSILFGQGGEYLLSFLDSGNLRGDGSLDLQARIEFVSNAIAGNEQIVAVSEPATFALLALGLTGLAIGKNRRRSA